MRASKNLRHEAPVALLVLGAMAGCSLVLDTDYDKYGRFEKPGAGGTTADAGGPDGDSGDAGAGGTTADVGPSDGDSGDTGGPDGPLDPPPAGEVCPYFAPPSCANGPKCSGDVDCCENRSMPAGTFAMGNNGTLGAEPEHTVYVSAACVDTFEVTVGRFRKFVESYERPSKGDGAHPLLPDSGWQTAWSTLIAGDETQLRTDVNCGEPRQTWSDEPTAEGEAKPMNCVTWYEAFAFCAWDGGRLLSEAEFEKAAAGGDEKRTFPWGSTPPNDSLANYCHSVSGVSCTDGSVAPMAVGNFPAGVGRWGHHDMAGNVWEWTLDWFSQAWYKNTTCNDCVNLHAPGDSCFFAPFEDAKVARGGAFNYGEDSMRSFGRGCNLPSYRDVDVGFRCIRDLM